MSDILEQLNVTHREIRNHPVSAGEGRSLLLRRSYDASIEDIWDACTNPDRIGRWLAPVTGDLRLGGTFEVEGNATGTVLRCERPNLLKVTWEYGAIRSPRSRFDWRRVPPATRSSSWNTPHRPRSSTLWCTARGRSGRSASVAAGT